MKYNRHIMGNGPRPCKKITKFGKFKTLAERLIAESKALQKYLDRIKK